MNLKAKRKSLLTAAQFAASVVKPSSTLAALSHLLIQPTESRAGFGVNLFALNLEVQASHWCATEEPNGDDDAFLIPAKLFIDTLSLSDAEQVEIVYDGKKANITLGARKLKLSTMPAEEFPAIMEVKGDSFDIASEVLGTQLSRVSFATSDDIEGRPILTNISVAFVKNALRFIGCDGKRGAITSIPFKGSGEFLLPPLLTSIVEKFCNSSDSDVVVTRSENAASFKFSDKEIVGKLFEGTYPNFESNIPQDRPHKCTLNREALIASLRAMETVQSGSFVGVKFQFGTKAVCLSSSNPENSGDETIASSACHMDPIMLPSDNLVEALTHLQNDEVTLEFVDHFSAMVIQEHDYLNVIMPLRLT